MSNLHGCSWKGPVHPLNSCRFVIFVLHHLHCLTGTAARLRAEMEEKLKTGERTSTIPAECWAKVDGRLLWVIENLYQLLPKSISASLYLKLESSWWFFKFCASQSTAYCMWVEFCEYLVNQSVEFLTRGCCLLKGQGITTVITVYTEGCSTFQIKLHGTASSS